MEQYVPFLRFNATAYETQTVLALSAVMLVAGLLSLLYGYRLYKVVAVVATGLLGAYVGQAFVAPMLPEGVAWLAPLVLALVGAVGALSIQRAVVFLAGAAVGFVSLGPVAAEMIWGGPEGPTPTHYLLAGLAAFVLMGILALVLFKPMVTVATAMFGATLLLSAVVHAVEKVSADHRGLYQAYPRELAWTFAGVAIVGVLFQATASKKRRLKP